MKIPYKNILLPDALFSLKVRIALVVYVAFFALMTAARTGTFWAASHYFETVPARLIRLSFLQGIRFDLHILGVLLCPLLILFMLLSLHSSFSLVMMHKSQTGGKPNETQ